MGETRAFDELRLELRAAAGGAGRYRVHAAASSILDTEVTVDTTLALSTTEIHAVVPELGATRGGGLSASPGIGVARKLGNALFTTALEDHRVYSLYTTARGRAKERQRGLRLVLRFDDAPELAALPWELLCDGPYFLALDAETPIVRSIETTRPPEPVSGARPLRVLGTVADVPGLPELDIEREQRLVDQALAKVRERGDVELTWIDATFAGLDDELRRATDSGSPYHVLHFIGHGIFDHDAGEGVVCFLDRNVTGFELVQILGRHGVRLVVLNSCEGARFDPRDPLSGVASALVHGGIPAVVAMQFPVSDDAAITFARGLYEGIAAEKPLDVAVGAARKAMFPSDAQHAEWATPVLFLLPGGADIFSSRPRRLDANLEALRKRWRLLAATGVVVAIIALVAARAIGGGGCPDEDVVDTLDVKSTWVSTSPGIEVCDGDLLRIAASGTIDHAPGQSTGPEGIPDTSGDNAYPTSIRDESNHGALIGRIGDGDWFHVGGAVALEVSTSGPIELAVNDIGIDNNAGAFQVTVRVERGDD